MNTPKLTKKEAIAKLESLLDYYGESLQDHPLDTLALGEDEDASHALEADLHYLAEEYGY